MASALVTRLEPFPAAGPAPAGSLVAHLERRSRELVYRLDLEVPGLVLPTSAPDGGERRDRLWQHTCAELFLGVPGRRDYLEWNLSPSGHWNLYRFDGYREGGREAPLEAPAGRWLTATDGGIIVEFTLPLEALGLVQLPLEIAACAVVETGAGLLSHWAVRHPAARPDFHDRRGFVLRLPVVPATGLRPREPEEAP